MNVGEKQHSGRPGAAPQAGNQHFGGPGGQDTAQGRRNIAMWLEVSELEIVRFQQFEPTAQGDKLMGRAAEHFPIDEPQLKELIQADDAASGDVAHVPRNGTFERAVEPRFNPLSDEPHPTIIAAVRRFGFVGLVLCAMAAPLIRAIRSLSHSFGSKRG